MDVLFEEKNMLKSCAFYYGVIVYGPFRKLNTFSHTKALIAAQANILESKPIDPQISNTFPMISKIPMSVRGNIETFNLRVQSLSKQFDVSPEEIKLYKKSICIHPEKMERRCNILKDYGFLGITWEAISNFQTLLIKSPADLLAESLLGSDPVCHALQLLPQEIGRAIGDQLSKDIYMHWPLVVIHIGLITVLLSLKLQCSQKEALLLIKRCNAITLRSVVDLCEIIKVLKERFGYTLDKFKIAPVNLLVDLRNILEIANDPDFDHLSPMCQQNRMLLLQNIQHIKCLLQLASESGITEQQFLKCKDVFRLQPDIIKQRLAEIEQIFEFRILKHDPCFLKLLAHLPRAKKNLERMKATKVTNYTINRFTNTRDTKGITANNFSRSTEVTYILSSALNKTPEEVKGRLKCHPKMGRVCYVNAYLVMEGLLAKGVTPEQLWQCVFVVLYNHQVVFQQYAEMQRLAELQPFERWQNHPMLLHLIIYYIEKNYLFIFEGVHAELV